jgi:hypothetical protein
MPDPFSSNTGLGMNVALLPAWAATFFTTYFWSWSWSAIFSKGWKRTLISAWPAEPTSWWWNSQRIPMDSRVVTILARRSPWVSPGAAGKYPCWERIL